ncbi:MAG: phosphopantetheine-binding protein [Verrucomicrobia bacterium]|nr:MAG: phosphopantetheine-binding protein [Verrucomicrobiota bacterium]
MSDELKSRIKKILVENLMLQMNPEEIQDDIALFAADGLKLDSIDALELSVAIEKNFAVITPNAQVAREAFVSVNTIAHYIQQNLPQFKT